MEKKVVVIGAGPAGLTAAYQMAKAGHRAVVLEKEAIVGGLSRTEEFKGFSFDMGGHRFFTKSREVDRMWREILADDLLHRPRLSRIFYKGKFFYYPLKPLNALVNLGFWQGILIVSSYLKWQLFPYKDEETFEHWVTNRFGKRLFLTFFKTYTEKVWGISCSELKAEWAAQRIKNLTLRTAIYDMILRPKNTIQTLIQSFDYPRRGPGMMWEAVRNRLENYGSEVCCDSEVVEVHRNGSRIESVVTRCNGHSVLTSGTDFISSMPVTDFVRKLCPPPPQRVLEAADRLKYRDFLTVCLVVNQSDLFPDNWIYIHDPGVKVGRIQNFKNWSPDMVPDSSKTSLGLEYFCNEGDELWRTSDQDLVELGKREVNLLGLARYSDIEDGCVYRVPKSYPVYDSQYARFLQVIKDFLSGFENFQTIGRNGLHRYNNQDHAMLTGMFAVENLLNGQNRDLWSVNADQEYHEIARDKKDVLPRDVDSAVEAAFVRVFSKLEPVSCAFSAGSVAGLILWAMTITLVLKGGIYVGKTLQLLGQYLPGYEVTVAGAFLGLAYGFGIGFLLGYVFAFLRNSSLFFYSALVHRGIERRMLQRLLEYIY